MKITNSSAGKVIKMPEGYRAFVPNNLPPKINWNNDVISALSRADHLLGRLSREGSNMKNPHILMEPFIAREAVLSSKIEGTIATIGDVLSSNIVHHHGGKGGADLQEVRNYIVALNHGIKRLKELPLSIPLIKEMHHELMQGARGSHATPGEFRKSPNWIGSPGCTLNNAKFVPPPPSYLLDCMGDLEKFLHNRSFPPLIHAAICHYQFEAIHPFLDGNGRIGRLLIILLLLEQKILPSPLLYLSAFFEASREKYYSHLYNVSSKGTWNEFFPFIFSRASRINRWMYCHV